MPRFEKCSTAVQMYFPYKLTLRLVNQESWRFLGYFLLLCVNTTLYYGYKNIVHFQLYAEGKESPGIFRNVPKTSSAIMWARHLHRLISEPIFEFDRLSVLKPKV